MVVRTAPEQEAAFRRYGSRALWQGAGRFGLDVGAAVGFDVPDPRAAYYLRVHGGELVARISDATRRSVGRLLTTAVDEGLSYARIASRLRDAYDFSWRRSLTIARTETAAAYTEGTLVAARTVAAAGLRTEKAWLVNEPEDEGCVENGLAGWVDLEAPFPSGVLRPPVHPNCECDLVYRVAE